MDYNIKREKLKFYPDTLLKYIRLYVIIYLTPVPESLSGCSAYVFVSHKYQEMSRYELGKSVGVLKVLPDGQIFSFL